MHLVFQLASSPNGDVLQNRIQYVPHVNDRFHMKNMMNFQASGSPEGQENPIVVNGLK